MPQPLLALILYSIVAIRFYTKVQDMNSNEEDYWQDQFINFIFATVICSCIPWLISDMSESSERWPEILHYVVVVFDLLIGGLFAFFLCRRKK